MMFGTLFLVCVALAAYPIVVYPIWILALSRVRGRPWEEGAFEGSVAHVITVHNEEGRIRRKLENSLSLASPPGGISTIVASDGSTDGTEAVVREYAERGVAWLGCPRRGKEDAQIDAVRSTAAPVIVFSDASTTIDHDALLALLAPFRDPSVAAVSGSDRLDTGGKGTGEDLYVRYEMAVRRAESLAGSLVGLSGCFFALRRDIAERLLPSVPSDMGAALICICQRKRAVAQERARCTYAATMDAEKEFRRKRRTALRGLRGLVAYREAMTCGTPISAFQVLSHKAMRFLVPIWLCLAVALAACGVARGEALALVEISVTGAMCVLGAASFALPELRGATPLRALGFFFLSNAAVLAAWWDLLAGRELSTWSPTARP
jgi:hypothetical protein